MDNLNANSLDIAVLAILIVFSFIGYKKGLILSIFSTCSWIVAFILTSYLYPILSTFIRNTGIYIALQNGIIETMSLTDLVEDTSRNIQSNQIENLNLPQNLINSILTNNNPEAYLVLGAENLEEYISCFIANGIINLVSMVIVFISIISLLQIAGQILNLVAKLPVINSFNKLGGVIFGLVPAVFLIWTIFAVLSIVFTAQEQHAFFITMNSSILANWFIINNPILGMITTIFP